MDFQQIGIGHPAVKDVLAIQNNTAPNRFGLLVAEGLWAARVVIDSGLRVDTFFWCPELVRSDEGHKRAHQLAERARRCFQVSEKAMTRMAERGNPGGLLVTAQMPKWISEDVQLDRSSLVLVADGLEIPGNLGTLIRTLDACRADLLIMTNRRTRKFTVYLADTDAGENYRALDYTGRTALVVGSERYGITPPWYAHGFRRVAVPMLGYADSLNVSVSASILLYEARARKDGW